MAMIYDPLGLASPIRLDGKHPIRNICEKHLQWDAHVENELEFIWHQWLRKLPDKITFPRSITNRQLRLIAKKGCSEAVNGVVRQGEHTSQGLLASKSRMGKNELITPRVELVAVHMVTNLVENVTSPVRLLGLTEYSFLCRIRRTNRARKHS